MWANTQILSQQKAMAEFNDDTNGVNTSPKQSLHDLQ